MTSHARSALVYVATACIVSSFITPGIVSAQPALSSQTPAAAQRGGTGATQIAGAAFHADDTPIPRAKLQLRNLISGTIAGAAVANDRGQFVFVDMTPGIYIVELISRSAKVLAVSDAVAVGRGDSATTFVRESGRPGSLQDLFVNAAIAVSSIAATTGITAISPQAKRPVSPQK
jgi:hypothetical protein